MRRISAYLMEGDLDGSPAVLRANAGKVFEGTKVYGAGFLFRDDKPASASNTLDAMNALLLREPASGAVIRQFLGGEEVYNHPEHRHFRYAIDLTGLSLSDADTRYPSVVAILRNVVKPYRNIVARPKTREFWWLFEESRPGLYSAIRNHTAVLVTSCAASPHWAIARVKNDGLFGNTLAVFTFSQFGTFGVLQSRLHETWARFFASTLEDRLRYTPTDCFETFPLPPGHDDAPALEATGQTYHDTRAALMVATVFAGFMLWSVTRFVYESWQIHEVAQGLLSIPIWIPQLSFVIGVWVFFIAVADELVSVLRGQPPAFRIAEEERSRSGDFSETL